MFIITSKDYNVVYSKDKKIKEKITTHRNKLNSFIIIQC